MRNRLNQILVEQTQNELFYDGNVDAAARVLVKQVADGLEVDRCSIWLYAADRTNIELQQIYRRATNEYHSGGFIYRESCSEYFDALDSNPIIIADDALSHPATSCFSEQYLKPLGIKSMLDVPVWHRGKLVGVICIESFTERAWLPNEIDFAQLISALYSFSYSVRESNSTWHTMLELEKFIDTAALISKADPAGRITYVNQKFTDISGWSLEDALGKDHSIVNSGEHPKEFWAEMYKTVVKDRGIWNAVVTNRTKNGELYYVDTYIKADFDSMTDKLLGFVSIRQDVTSLMRSSQEIEKKNSYLEHSAKIIRHDMHSGINTYIPRGISSLERRLTPETISSLGIEAPLKMIKEGLRHTQKVYKGVYEFTNLVKIGACLNRTECKLSDILIDYLTATAYRHMVQVEDLGTELVNEPLFCTAVDNLIRNGLKYNDSNSKLIRIFREGDLIHIQDNGRGLTQAEFTELSKPYTRKPGQAEEGTGLGLNISIAIFEEHGFDVSCRRLEKNGLIFGTKITIKIQ
jgi:PAS domain S-box-containing protein